MDALRVAGGLQVDHARVLPADDPVYEARRAVVRDDLVHDHRVHAHAVVLQRFYETLRLCRAGAWESKVRIGEFVRAPSDLDE